MRPPVSTTLTDLHLAAAAQIAQDLFHMRRQRRRKGHPLARARMADTEPAGVQALPLQVPRAAAGAVKRISHHGVADVDHLPPYLVCASPLPPGPDVRVPGSPRPPLLV